MTRRPVCVRDGDPNVLELCRMPAASYGAPPSNCRVTTCVNNVGNRHTINRSPKTATGGGEGEIVPTPETNATRNVAAREDPHVGLGFAVV